MFFGSIKVARIGMVRHGALLDRREVETGNYRFKSYPCQP